MKRILILLFTLIQIALSVNSAAGQTVEALRLKRDYYYDKLDKIIDAIGKDLNIRFVYDREHLKKILWSTLERHSGRGSTKRLSALAHLGCPPGAYPRT